MNRYRHFDNEIDLHNTNSAAILPENETDEPLQVEFSPQLQNYSSKFKKFKFCFSRRTRLERYSFFFIILLLIILFIVITAFLSYHKRTSATNSFCETSSCIELSYSLSSGMNQSVDPCEDFHEFVCGRWIRTNLIPKGYSAWSVIKELGRKNMIVLKTILEQTPMSSLVTAEQDAMKYYQSCMNTTELERLNIQPLENYFQNIFNLTIKQWINLNQNQNLQELFVNLTKIFSTKHLFAYVLPIHVDPDEKNSTWNNINIDQPELVLESRDYYINATNDSQSNARNQIIRETYRNVGVDLLGLLGFEKNDSIQRMNDIIQFETELAEISLPMEILQKPNETYFLMPLKQLQEQYQSIGFDVISLFNDMLNLNISNPIKLNENDPIIVLSFKVMSKLSMILSNYLSTPNKSHIIIDYLLFSFLVDISPYLSLDFEKTLLPLKAQLYGIEALPERWEFCVEHTDISFGFALGALFIKTVFGESDRSRANELIKNIRQTFEENLRELQWIDEESKTEAKKKLNKINEKIGYPDFIKDQMKLNERYAGYPMNENEYFNNGMKVINRERRRTLLKFRQKVDRTQWSMTPRTVNAHYSSSTNEIVFPAGILQPPFFHKDLPIEINYGSIGSVIGHEITHGFDNQGRDFDADGNMRSWWTKFALGNFEEKTKCFIKQYSAFALDGQRTLGENIADNGGIKLSYYAYLKQKQGTSHLRLPGLNYTSDQLFFIAFGHSWCSIKTPNAMHHDLINNPHSPARFRVIGTLQNSDEFAKAFSCKPKTIMNPSDKCQLW